jgi:Uncharacterized protein involved in outer membrane biogenesis
MTEDEQERRRAKPRWLWISLTAVLALLLILIVPPLVSVSRYKSQITSVIARSLGRPVRLSSVHVRLLPRPGFVLYDLVVDDNPAFGAEPVIHANSVTAPIRIWSLWRGRLEISEISVDEASLNLVRTPEGSWNLDSLIESTATNAGKAESQGRHTPFPRLVASNSRINIKSGIEKLPYSLIDTDLSFWQSNPGEWRLRLRGQPARTDVSMNSSDTGIVEIQATARQTADLGQMPIHLDLDWRNAQLGQLTRLATGSDAGWRGDLRGEVHVDGTPENAQIKTRLRATGVHRAEFAPAEPMDFDANCSLAYHHTARSIQNLLCDSPIGSGRIRIAGEMAGTGHVPRYSVEMDRVPVAASLEALRTVRSGVDPNLTAAGTISGKVSYDETTPPENAQQKATASPNHSRTHAAKTVTTVVGPFTGSFTVDGLQLNGGGLTKPLIAPSTVIAPTATAPGHSQALAGTVVISAGAPVPLAINVQFALSSYQMAVHGQLSVDRAREIVHASGLPQEFALDKLTGDPLTVDLRAQGPWLPPLDNSIGVSQPVIPASGIIRGIVRSVGADDSITPTADSLSGTVTVHNANWKSDYLANSVEIANAIVRVDDGLIRWDPVSFTYGPLKGSATLTIPKSCEPGEPCPAESLPSVNIKFGSLDAATMQTAILGAREKGTLLSDLLNRLRPSATPVWPRMLGSIAAESLVLGPVTLQNARAELHISATGIDITALDAKMLGGTLHATGTLVTGDKPDYTLAAELRKLSPAAVGQLAGQNWRGGTFDCSGKLELAGYTGSDLADSAKGALHFEWRNGSVAGAGTPGELGRFDRWTADAQIGDGKVTIGKNEIAKGSRKATVSARAELAKPVKVSFEAEQTPKVDKPVPATRPAIRGR